MVVLVCRQDKLHNDYTNKPIPTSFFIHDTNCSVGYVMWLLGTALWSKKIEWRHCNSCTKKDINYQICFRKPQKPFYWASPVQWKELWLPGCLRCDSQYIHPPHALEKFQVTHNMVISVACFFSQCLALNRYKECAECVRNPRTNVWDWVME